MRFTASYLCNLGSYSICLCLSFLMYGIRNEDGSSFLMSIRMTSHKGSVHSQQVPLPLEKVPQTRPCRAMPSSFERARVQRHSQTPSPSTELALSPLKHRIRSAEGQAAPRVYRGGPSHMAVGHLASPQSGLQCLGWWAGRCPQALVAPGVHLREAFPAQHPHSRSILQTPFLPRPEITSTERLLYLCRQGWRGWG